MPSLDLIQVIIQGGAVGLLLAFGYLSYKLANKLIDTGTTVMTNHLAHLDQTLNKVDDSVVRLEAVIRSCPVSQGKLERLVEKIKEEKRAS